VFNAKHIKTQDGESLEKKLIGEITHVQEDVALAENMLKEYIRIEGVGYEEKGTRAFYSPVTDSICVPKKKNFKSDSAFIQTLAHEISHSTGHEKRLNRKFGENFESENYAIEELRAEVASAFLCSDFNVPSMNCILQNSKRYIQNWTEGLKESPKKLHIYKDAQTPLDILSKAGITICLFEKNEVFLSTKPFYDNVQDIEPLKLGKHLWSGFTCTSLNYPYTILESTHEGVTFQVMILKENGEHVISLDDSDVSSIIESISACDK